MLPATDEPALCGAKLAPTSHMPPTATGFALAQVVEPLRSGTTELALSLVKVRNEDWREQRRLNRISA